MHALLTLLTCGSFLLLAFVVAANPRKVNVVGNRWLAIFLVLIALIMIDDPLKYSKFYEAYPIFIGLSNLPVFAVAPTLYLSIVFFVSPVRQFRRKDLWHFTPVFLLTPFIFMYLFLPKESKMANLGSENTTIDIIIAFILLILPISIYWFLAYKKLRTHQKNVQLFASSPETVDLAWLRHFLEGLLFMIAAWAFEITEWFPFVAAFSSAVYFFTAYYLAYFAVHQGEVFSSKKEEILDIKSIIEENASPELSKKSLLSDTQIADLKPQLTGLMDAQKPYLDSNLSLSKLADLMQLSTHELSFLINTGFEDNFYGFVNRYRIEESKRILTTPQYQHLSMVGIAFEAGFNSKTAFNTAFKKMVGVSPTEFQKENTK